LFSHASGLLRGNHSAFEGFAFHAGHIDSGAVVRDFDQDLPALVARDEFDVPLGSLAARRSQFRHFNSMIHRIADDMGERILDGFEKASVQFGFLSFHLNQHLLTAGRGHIAHDPRELVKNVTDGLHTRLHDFFLQFAGEHIQLL
jgi:hypothetical protein